MGCYINPPTITKEQWLRENAQPIAESSAKAVLSSDSVPVCLVDNGMFTAAAVGYSLREIEAFQYPDGRPKEWYVAKRDAVRAVSDLHIYER